MSTETLCGEEYLRMLKNGASQLNSNRKIVNDLNVFPVPDGDTGDNMYMTIRSGCDAVSSKDIASIGNVASAASKGMLLGARGNSGVILSRFFAGVAKGLSGVETARLEDWCRAMESGVAEAYASVVVPVEGTILTVVRESVAKANSVSVEGFDGWFEAFRKELSASLNRTPELLDVLRNAGVVDSGGAGFAYIAEGMEAALSGKAVDDSDGVSLQDSQKLDLSAFTEDSILEFGYCTEFLLRLQSSKVSLDSFDESVIKAYLEKAGGSLVFFREGSIIKVHIHTRTPGDILNACQQWGEYLTIKIENMTLQHHGNRMEKVVSGPRKQVAVVTVVSGEGLSALFKDMGADFVIEGGQTMNPSSEDFIRAFDKVNSALVYVLPNNSNIIMAAQQAASLYGKSEVCVLPTRTIGAGYAVLGSVDFHSSSKADVEREVEDISGQVVTGMISTAVRDTAEVKEGEYIGFSSSDILCSSSDRSCVLVKMCEALEAGKYDVMLVIKGKNAPRKEAEDVVKELQDKYVRSEIVLVDGGQPVYDYIIVLE